MGIGLTDRRWQSQLRKNMEELPVSQAWRALWVRAATVRLRARTLGLVAGFIAVAAGCGGSDAVKVDFSKRANVPSVRAVRGIPARSAANPRAALGLAAL